MVALLRSSTLFISHLGEESLYKLMIAAAAHDQAVNRSGKTITPADVLKAVSELDFGPADVLIPLLERELSGRQLQCIADASLSRSSPNKKGEKVRGVITAGPCPQCCIADVSFIKNFVPSQRSSPIDPESCALSRLGQSSRRWRLWLLKMTCLISIIRHLRT